jgi:hypothetical protein
MHHSTRLVLTPALLAASIFLVNAGVAQNTPPPPTALDQATPPQTSTTTLILPAGTVVPLTLVNMIKLKSTPIGGMVRATVAFPVTLGTHLAIPAGVFVEGELIQSSFPKGYKQPKGAPPASPLKVHFTKLIYPNGYTVTLDALVSALIIPLIDNISEQEQLAALDPPNTLSAHGPSMDEPFSAPFDAPQQQNPSPANPFAHAGPNPAVIYGPLIFVAAIATALVIGSHHHGESLDAVAFGAGYPFEMTLTSPLVLDRTRIDKEASVADASAQPYAIR